MRLALGSAQFGLDYGIANQQGQVSQDQVRLILAHAKAHGISTLDTAISYGNSEQQLGEIGVADWQVVSKLPGLPDDCQDIEAWVHNEVRVSLGRLCVTSLKGLLLHRPEQLLGKYGEEIYQALLSIKQQGLVEKIGVSIYDPIELDSLTQNFQLELVQAPFNVFDRRLITSGWLDRLSKMNIELHARSVFLQGLLLMPNTKRPNKFDRWQSLWQGWERWLEETGLTPLQVCLRDALAQPGISRVIVGVDSLAQLKEILLALDGSVPELPKSLYINDIDLINPARWKEL